MFDSLISAARAVTGAGLGSIGHDEMVEVVTSRSATIIDVRERGETAYGMIAGAFNVPLSAFDPSKISREKPVIVYCASGARSGMAQQQLLAAGFSDVRNYRPGFGIWKMQGGAVD